MKLVIIEPNLKTYTGHVYEAMRAIDDFLRGYDGECYLVSHKDVDVETRKSFQKLWPLATLSCFELGDDEKVIDYIRGIIQRFSLCENDLIVFCTAHLRELGAVAELSNLCGFPRFILQIHQFYPPLKDADDIFLDEVNSNLDKAWMFGFEKINWGRVRVATTCVKALNDRLSRLSPVRLEQFPVAFLEIESEVVGIGENFVVGMVGDGRKERGLLTFLMLSKLLVRDRNIRVTVQIQNPRGFSAGELEEIERLGEDLMECERVVILDGPVQSEVYQYELGKIDVMVLPYYPRHYCIRLSGIAVECGMRGIPVVAFKGTSMVDWIDKGFLVGIIVDYCTNDQLEENLEKAVNKVKANLREFRRKAMKIRRYWIETYSAKNYLENYVLR